MHNDGYFHAKILRVIDGDTVRAEMYCYRDEIVVRKNLRLYGIDAPEKKGPTKREGLSAMEHLKELLSLHDGIFVHVVGTDKYGGREDAILYQTEDDERKGIKGSINHKMIDDGHAVAAYYGQGRVR